MPHVIIEYSANIAEATDIDAFVGAIHDAVVDDGIGPTSGVRTRAVARDFYRIADNDPSYGFLAIVARIGPGRSPAEIQRFLTRLVDTADAVVESIADQVVVAISAEIQFIDAAVRINRNQVAHAMAEAI